MGAAAAGVFDGELALDGLHATSTSDALSGAGPQPGLSATELGVHALGDLEVGRFRFDLDYWGREPLAGTFPTVPVRMLYRAEAQITAIEDHLVVGLGRFVAPSARFTPVDGARLVWTPTEPLRLEVFGGRRGADSAQHGLGFDTFLPAAGVAGRFAVDAGGAELRAAYSRDVVELGTWESRTDTDPYGAFDAQVRGWARPAEGLDVGASGTFAQRATYVLTAPGAGVPLVEVDAGDLFQVVGYVAWRPADDVRVAFDVVRQRAEVHAGTPLADPPGPDVALVDPTFVDNRLKAAIRPADLGWVRPEVRLRLRPDQTELRYGGALALDHLGVVGPVVNGALFLEDVLSDDPAVDAGPIDRLTWLASAGYARGGVDVEAGASFVDRALAPVSARSTAAVASDDLSPFVLEAQNVAFLRGFLTHRTLFGGADVEVSLTQPEVRVFLQIGARTEARW